MGVAETGTDVRLGERFFTARECGGRRMALAATVLTGLGVRLRMREGLDDQIDRDMLAQVVRYDSPHLGHGSSLGIARTLLHHSMQVSVIGHGRDALERADLVELNAFSRFEHRERNPCTEDLIGQSAIDGMVWMDIPGGLNGSRRGRRGLLRRSSLVVHEVDQEKVAVFDPENPIRTPEGKGYLAQWLAPDRLFMNCSQTLLFRAAPVEEPVHELSVGG